jgi:hypothetical protein
MHCVMMTSAYNSNAYFDKFDDSVIRRFCQSCEIFSGLFRLNRKCSSYVGGNFGSRITSFRCRLMHESRHRRFANVIQADSLSLNMCYIYVILRIFYRVLLFWEVLGPKQSWLVFQLGTSDIAKLGMYVQDHLVFLRAFTGQIHCITLLSLAKRNIIITEVSSLVTPNIYEVEPS